MLGVEKWEEHLVVSSCFVTLENLDETNQRRIVADDTQEDESLTVSNKVYMYTTIQVPCMILLQHVVVWIELIFNPSPISQGWAPRRPIHFVFTFCTAIVIICVRSIHICTLSLTESSITFCLIWPRRYAGHCLSGGPCGEGVASHGLSDCHSRAAPGQADSGGEQGDSTARIHTQVSCCESCTVLIC